MKRLGAVKTFIVTTGLLASLTTGAVHAQTAQAFALPDAVAASLKAANLPPSAVGIAVAPVSGPGLTLAVNESQPMNPASTMKLVTTLAGLELLGPQYQWRTDVLSAAPLKNGVLEGDLWLRGSGDPQLVIENLWLLVQRVRGAGVREIRGNLMLDRSAFEAAQHDPGAFDGEALRPYNAGPDACCSTTKAVSLYFLAIRKTSKRGCLRCRPWPAWSHPPLCAARKVHVTTGARGWVVTSPTHCDRRFGVPILFPVATRCGTSARSKRACMRKLCFGRYGIRAAAYGADGCARVSFQQTQSGSRSMSPVLLPK